MLRIYFDEVIIMQTTSKITKWGNSQGLIIPKSVLTDVNFKTNDKVLISTSADSIIIKRIKRRRTLAEIFEGHNQYYELTEISTGQPVGKELW
jgi:antitoxin MazE